MLESSTSARPWTEGASSSTSPKAWGSRATGVAGLGDLNADGFDDFVVGHQRNASSAGEAFVIFGSDQLADASVDGVISRSSIIDQGLAVRISGASPEADLGVGAASADIDQDGLQDLLLTAPDNEELGNVIVVFGSELSSSPARSTLRTSAAS